ncbi:MAG: helix-turn-helix transcriptional regulator [Rhodobacteraceae bacterium]|nr:helix-turn-helix transcriptional regulator [Paracoccaceae bacterium]
MSNVINTQESSATKEAEVSALIARVGERVRKAREGKGIPRRVLSEISGVSPRYLAQLESGEGNISIGLLQRVAAALGLRIDMLVSEDDPLTSQALQVVDLFRKADGDVQQAVMRKLGMGRKKRARRICLIGLRGAGKSTLGALAANALGLPFIELNSEIEAQSGMPVNEVIALYGPEGYRRLEAEAIARVIASHDDLILAVAGGIVGEAETYAQLLRHFHSVWLRATPEEHMARVRDQGDERPMAGNPEAMDQLRSILTSREVPYGQAQAQLDTSGRDVDVSLGQLLEVIQKGGFLNKDGLKTHPTIE